MTNEIPYMSEKNADLISPSDFINPQGENHEGILQLPTTFGLADLKHRKQLLVEKMEILRETRLEEMCRDYERFLITK